MKGKTCLCFLICVIVFLAGGCSGGTETESGYTINYVNAAGTSLYDVSYDPKAETFDELMTELFGQLAQPPANSVYVSALPDYVEYLGYERGIDALRINFSSGYYDMSNTQEVLLRAAVVRTICQIPGVTKIIITVEGQQLADSNGEPVPAMDAETFIDTKNGGINSYQYATLTLYFPDAEGTKLVREERDLHYSSNMLLERVVVEQLLKGSEYSERRQPVNSSAVILDISSKDGVCTINFSGEFNQIPTESVPSAEAALYAVVNSVCESDSDVEGVRFQVNGESDVTFWGEISLNQVFYPNENLIETEPPESETVLSGSGTETSESGAG